MKLNNTAMLFKTVVLLLSLVIYNHTGFTQSIPKGNLFIIGGGDRPAAMMQKMVEAAGLTPKDHIAILTMSSASPDTSYYYIKEDLRPHCANTIAMLHFTKENTSDRVMLDSLKKAKLIFITGGVQDRFMNVVFNTPVFETIHQAYQLGSTIAGTSAGAAVMSKEMITGSQIRADTIYDGSFDRIENGNVEIKPGLGLLTNAIIDQHFVVRSRYNRLLTILSQYPGKTAIGIDEATAILVKGNEVEVIGESQVIVVRNPQLVKSVKGKVVSFKNANLSIYTDGEKFRL
jgi:cyanophycinase